MFCYFWDILPYFWHFYRFISIFWVSFDFFSYFDYFFIFLILFPGHSQGNTAFFVMASERSEYMKYILFMAAMAPPIFMGNINNSLIQLNVQNLEMIEVNIFDFLEFCCVFEIILHNFFFLKCNNSILVQIIGNDRINGNV